MRNFPPAELNTYTYQRRSQTMTIGLVLVYAAVFGFLLWGNRVDILTYYYPAATLMLGLWLYSEAPHMYVGLVWWIWFITPFVRRIIDYKLGYYTLDPVSMLTPFLVVLITVITFFRYGRRLLNRTYLPFLLVIAALVYAVFVGLARGVAPFTLVVQLLEWMTPVLFGFHLAVLWHEYPRNRAVVRRTFMWGVVVMGAYGILQYFVVPPWDAMWMVGSKMTSIGHPEPFEIRVFSTLNAPGPFAMVMMAGLILLFEGRGIAARFATVFGYGGYLLAVVRGSWIGWVIALLYLIWRIQGVLKMRLIAILGVGVVLLVPLLTLAPVAERLAERADTLTEIEEDGSFKARSRLYARVGELVLANPVGRGLGKYTFDSGFITLFYVLGWPGTLLYLSGVILLLRDAFRCTVANTDQFTVMVVSVVVAYFLLLVAANQFTGVKGCVVWGFLGMTVASRMYYLAHRTSHEPAISAG